MDDIWRALEIFLGAILGLLFAGAFKAFVSHMDKLFENKEKGS